MTQWLKQSTAVTLTIGQFVSYVDGYTPATGLAAGTVDEIGVYKHGATALTDISGTTTFTHRAGGMYTLTLSTTDTNTLGMLTVFVRDDSVCLSHSPTYMVVPANVYDSMVGGTDVLAADVTQINGATTPVGNLEDDYDGTGYTKANSTIGTTTTNTDMRGTDGANTTVPDNAGIAAIQAVTDNLPDAGALTNLDAAISTRATPAQVNAEVVDVLTVDTYAELAAVPAATSTILAKLNWLFLRARNKVTETATTQTVYDDAGTGAVATSTISDDGTTLTRGEYS
jgi:hypothetical protein